MQKIQKYLVKLQWQKMGDECTPLLNRLWSHCEMIFVDLKRKIDDLLCN